MIHNLKIESEYFERILIGEKPFEIRLNDRGYQKYDKVILNEIGSTRKISADIGYVCSFMQFNGFVVFSLLNVELLK